MNKIFNIAIEEIKVLFKEKIFFVLLSVFILMSFLSSSLGFIATKTTTSIYNSSVIFLTQKGVSNIPTNPISSFGALTDFRNIIIYMFLIGALLAVVIGHRSFIRERKSGTLPLLLSRPISSFDLFLGKAVGIGVIIFLIIFASFLIGILSSLILPFRHLSSEDIVRLILFYILSFFYLLLFAFIGLFFAIKTKSESLALFIPICIWVGISFVLPELISGANPTALLNPITMNQELTQNSAFFSLMQNYLQPFSIGGQYVSFSSELLNNSPQTILLGIMEIISRNILNIITLMISIGGVSALCIYSIKQNNIGEEKIYE
ncbi:MAG: ABC transporter permease subunit [Patescibacteria group bacterium]